MELARRLYLRKDGKAEQWTLRRAAPGYQLVQHTGRPARLKQKACTDHILLEGGLQALSDATFALPLFGYTLVESDDRAEKPAPAHWIPAGERQPGLVPAFI